jgi:nitrite reductase/ring-hydroxylating ferredoxin subunit
VTNVDVTAPARAERAARYEAGALEDFPVGKFRIVTLGQREVGIIRLADGEVHAVLNRCPHKGAPVCKGIVGGTWPPSEVGKLAFEREGEVLTCPWHGFEFDLRSGVEVYQERPTRLKKFKATVEGGMVVVTI